MQGRTGWKSRRGGSGLGRTRGWLAGTILSQSRNVLPNGEDTLRISVARREGSRGETEGDARGFARNAPLALRILLLSLGNEEE